MAVSWPDLKLPPINLLVLPKHEVLLEYINAMYMKHYGDLWDSKEYYNRVQDGRLVLTVNGEYNVEHDN